MVKLSLAFLPENFWETIEIVKLAEKWGFEAAWFVDGHILWMDLYSFLTACALNTSRIKIGPQVTNPITRHPTVTASNIATLNVLSNGRAILGIGKGDNAVRTIGHRPAKLGRLEESVKLIRALSSGEEVEYHGQRLQLRWAKGRIPIHVSATGPQVLELAGRISDGVVLYVGAIPSLIEWALTHVHRGAREAGRNTEEIETICYTTCYVSEDIEKAREAVRWCPAAASNHIRDVIARVGVENLPQELVRDAEQMWSKYDYTHHLYSDAPHTAYLTDDFIDRFTIIGSIDDCIGKMKKLETTGVDHITLALFGMPEKRYIIETLGKKMDEITGE